MAIRKKIDLLEDTQGFNVKSLYNAIPNNVTTYSELVLGSAAKLTNIDYADLANRWTTPAFTALGTVALDYMKIYYEITKEETPQVGDKTDNKFKKLIKNAGKNIASQANNFKNNVALASDKLLWGTAELREVILFDIYVTSTKSYNTVESTPNGFDGCISEYISTSPMMLSFRGRLVGSTEFQQDHFSIMKLRSICDQKKYPVKIINSYLNRALGVTELIIKSLEIDESNEATNMNSFTINAIAYNSANEKDIIIKEITI